jgi:PAS domain S-box-containing protein
MLTDSGTRKRIFQFKPQVGYQLAGLLTALTLACVYTLHLKLGIVAFQLSLSAVAVIALFAGIGPAALAVLLLLFGLAWIAEPGGSFAIAFISDRYRLALFLGCSLMVVWIARRFQSENLMAIEAQTRLADFIDNLDHSISWDARTSDLSFVLISKHVEDFIGYTQEEWMEMGPSVWSKLVPEEDQAPVKSALETVRQKKAKSSRSEHRFITKDGKVRWFQTGVVLKEDPKRGDQLYGISAEITPLKMAQAELLENKRHLEHLLSANSLQKERLASVVDTALDAIVTIDERGSITSWNQAARKMFGYESEEVIGRNVKMLMPEPYRREHDGYLQAYERTGIRKIIGIGREVTGQKKDGTVFPINLAVSEFWVEGERNFTGVIQDLTQRKRAEAERAATETLLSVAIKNAPITIYTCDRDLRYTWIYGVPKSFIDIDFIGKTDAEVLEPSSANALMDLKSRALTTGETQRGTISVSSKDVIYTFDVSAEPKRNESGEVDGLIVAALDVSNISEAKVRAESANKAKTDFLANISHEIRTPIGVIKGFAELLLDQEQKADARQMIGTIIRSSEQLMNILGQVLDLSKIEADHLDLEIIEFSLEELIDDLKSLLNFKAEQKGLRFQITVYGDCPTRLISDPTRLKQILVNLGSNAIKFAREGTVEMAFRCLDERNGLCLSMEIAVQDTGIGMTKEQQSRLFAPFMQADTSTTRRFGGTGLGLFISKRLARALGGDLNLVRSAPNQGSEFVLTINSRHRAETIRPKRTERETMPSSSMQLADTKILLAEDSPDNQTLVTRLLQKHGADIDIANNGLEAIDRVRYEKFDVILMDIQMPEADGFEATKRIREMGYTGPIVALTAHAMKEERERAMKLGFDGYVTKPVNRAELIRTIMDLSS